jgi:uncharacterized membrane protein YcaP (DUF421 family)
MWFDSWSDVLRILAVGAAAYATLIVLLRMTGKRTLAKLNAFDWVVSVAIGSTLATILLSTDVSWTEGATALTLLAGLQLVVARVTTWLPGARSFVTAEPRLLLVDGRPIEQAMTSERISMGELRQAIRASGTGDLSSVTAVVLETDGSLSVISASKAGDLSALADVARSG